MPGAYPYETFLQDNIPDWCCPACLNASLEMVPGSFMSQLSAFSRENRHEQWYEAEHETYVFSCMLRCSRRACHESVAVSGSGQGELDRDDNSVYTLYQAKSFVPPLPVFTIPRKCPKEISRQLHMVSALLPLSENSAVNAMRITLELLLDELRVPRETTGENPQRIPLARRIQDRREVLGAQFEFFDALKDLGNHGSHTDDPIRRSHIEGACRLLNELVQQLFGHVPDHSRLVTTLKKTYGRKKNGD